MNGTRALRVTLATGILAAGLTACGGGKVSHYSAKQVHLDPSGNVRGATMYYVSGDKFRTESTSPEGKGSMVIIADREARKMWMLNPAGKAYWEKELEEEDLQKSLGLVMHREEAESLGHEKVNGYKCEKMRVETSMEVMGFSRTSTSTVWMCDRFDIPLRVQTENGGAMELRDIKPGRQPADLFKVPDDYKAVDNMFMLFAGSGSRGTRRSSGDSDSSVEDAAAKAAEGMSELFKKLGQQLEQKK